MEHSGKQDYLSSASPIIKPSRAPTTSGPQYKNRDVPQLCADSTPRTMDPDLRPCPLCLWQVRFFEITAFVNRKWQGKGQTENPILVLKKGFFHRQSVGRVITFRRAIKMKFK